jgi:hypothetical protein
VDPVKRIIAIAEREHRKRQHQELTDLTLPPSDTGQNPKKQRSTQDVNHGPHGEAKRP